MDSPWTDWKKRGLARMAGRGGPIHPQDTSLLHTRPSAIFQSTEPRKFTISVAIPTSILQTAPTHELKTLLIGQISRAGAVGRVDEFIIYNDTGHEPNGEEWPSEDDYTADVWPTVFIGRLLEYQNTPPALRRDKYPFSRDLRHQGLLPSVDMPHHARKHEWIEFREGIEYDISESQIPKHLLPAEGTFCLVKTGLDSETILHHPPCGLGTEYLVRYRSKTAPPEFYRGEPLEADPVDIDSPGEEIGLYFGWRVEEVDYLSQVFTNTASWYDYDLVIGTSERGQPLEEALASFNIDPPPFKHALILLGGPAGLEQAMLNDPNLQAHGITDPSAMCDMYVNFIPQQGSRTIRTEEALWLAIQGLNPIFQRREQQHRQAPKSSRFM